MRMSGLDMANTLFGFPWSIDLPDLTGVGQSLPKHLRWVLNPGEY